MRLKIISNLNQQDHIGLPLLGLIFWTGVAIISIGYVGYLIGLYFYFWK